MCVHVSVCVCLVCMCACVVAVKNYISIWVLVSSRARLCWRQAGCGLWAVGVAAHTLVIGKQFGNVLMANLCNFRHFCLMR